MVSDLQGSDLKGYILEATRTWYEQHEFSDCRCDIVFVRHKDNFLTRSAAKSNLSSFQSLALCNVMVTASIRSQNVDLKMKSLVSPELTGVATTISAPCCKDFDCSHLLPPPNTATA